MLETLFTTDMPHWLRSPFSTWEAPTNANIIIFALSLASSVILAYRTNGLKLVTLPIFYFALSMSARFVNAALQNLQLDGLAGDQRIMAFTIAGHIAIGPVLLFIFRSSLES